MKAVVMAGGEGSRLRPLTAQLPKPLLPVAGRPVMEHIVNLLRRHGITEIVATVHYLADMIEEHFGDGSAFGVRMHYEREETPLGTAGAVKQAHDFLRDDAFLIISGDSLTDIDLTALIADHREHRVAATIALTHVAQAFPFGIALTDDDHHITRFLEKPSWGSIFADTINTGIYVLEPSILDMLEPGKAYDFSHDVFPRLLEQNKTLLGHIAQGYWADIGTVGQYRQSCFDALNARVRLRIPGKAVSSGVFADEDANIHRTAYLEGPIVLGRNVRIEAGVRIEGPTIIGDNCTVGKSARLTRTITWNDVHIGEAAMIDGGIFADGNAIAAHSTISTAAVRGPACAANV